jgi:hypothetical protein
VTSPLEIPNYSRFRITIIDKRGEKSITPFANIPEDDVPVISKITDVAIQTYIEAQNPTVETDGNEGFAQTVRFKMGIYVGKTPMEVLLEDPEKNIPKLEEQKVFLAANVEKFPYNKNVLEAIDEAIAAHKSGKTVAAPAQKSSYIVIYDQKIKFLEKIKDDEDPERCKIYSVTMSFDSTKNYPFAVRVANAYAKVVPTKTGGKNVDPKTIVKKTESTMNLTVDEFVKLISRMQDFHVAFTTVNFAPQYRKALEKEAENKERAMK